MRTKDASPGDIGVVKREEVSLDGLRSGSLAKVSERQTSNDF